MKNIFAALLLVTVAAVWPHTSMAQQQHIQCNVSTGTDCNTTTNPGNGQQGDPAWVAFGKTNANFNQIFNILGPTGALPTPAYGVQVNNNGALASLLPGSTGTWCFNWSSLSATPTLVGCGSGSGTVTSVGLTMPSWLSVSGSPVLTGGVLAVSGTIQPNNYVLASAATGSNTVLSPRALVAADIPSIPNTSVSGLGTFATQNYASPPPIGGSTPASGTFSSITDSGITGTTQCLHVNTAGTISGTGSDCGSGSGGVTSFSGDGVLISNSISAGAVTVTLQSTGVGYGVLGNLGASSGAPGYHALSSYPTVAFPTLNQSTTGNAATATALVATPTQCTGGQFATGVAATGNANCGTPAGSGNVSTSGSPTQYQTPAWASGTTVQGIGPGVAGQAYVSGGASAYPSFSSSLNDVTSVNSTTIPASATLLTNGGALGTPSSGIATNLTGLPLTTGVTGVLPGANVAAVALGSSGNGGVSGTLGVGNGGTGATTLAGASIVVFSGTPVSGHCVEWLSSTAVEDAGSVCGSGGSTAFSALTSSTNTTAAMLVGTGASLAATGSGTITATNTTGVNSAAVPASALVLGSNSSSQLVSDSTTGTGAVVLATSPSLTTPALGTPSSGTMTNVTGLPISTGVSGLGTGVATFLATPTSANLAGALTNETGTTLAVFNTSPTLVTPAIAGSSTGTTTIASANASATSYTATLPANTGTFAELNLAQTFSALQTFGTNISIGGVTAGGATGTGNVVFGTSPTLVTPALGTPTALVLTNATGLPNASVIGLGTFATQNYATPPAIGGTTPAAGAFTTLSATGNLTTNVTGSTQCLQVSSAGVVSGTGSGCASSPAFSVITSGTNTAAAMVVGSGASLAATGSGTIAATSLTTLTGLPTIANNTLLANTSGGTAAPSATSAAAALGLLQGITCNPQTGTTYTTAIGDANGCVTMSNTAANTVTIPTNASVAYIVGTTLTLQQINTGITTVSPASGVTLCSLQYGCSGSQTYTLAGQDDFLQIQQTTANNWLVTEVGPGRINMAGTVNLASTAFGGVTGTLLIANGGTGATTLAGASIATWSGTPTAGHCVEWLSSTVIEDAGSACGSGGSGAFSSLTSGTNTTAAMLVGTGASLATSGTGTITASGLNATGLGTANTWSALQTFGTNISIGGVTATGATGTGAVVFGTSPTLATPALGTPSAINLTNAAAGSLPLTAVATIANNTILANGSGSTASASATTAPNVIAILNAPTCNAQTGTTYTGVLGDANGCVTMSNSSANTFTVPPNSGVAYPVGTTLTVEALGTGITTITPGAGVTLQSPQYGASTSISYNLVGAYDFAQFKQISANAWLLTALGPGRGTAPIDVGTKFTLGTGTGTCATSSTLVGGAATGKFTCTGTSGASTQVINLPTAPNGWVCEGNDLTTTTDTVHQTASATNSATLSGTIVANDVVNFMCSGY